MLTSFLESSIDYQMKYIVLALLFLCAPLASAHNNLFFPGDAYFSTTWQMKKLELKDKSLTFGYFRLSQVFMACGYAGCSNLQVNELPDNYVANLKKANELLEKKYKHLATIDTYKEADKTPYFRAFIYNKNYDFAKLGIGYKFNENWAKLQTENAKRGHAIYDGVLSTIFDWEHAAEVPGLSLTKKPKSLEAFMGVEEAIEGNAKDYSIVIVLGNYLDEIAEDKMNKDFGQKRKADKKEPDAFQFLVIDDKIRLFTRTHEGKLVSKVIP